ncbi:MAG: prolyl oligopeptidase family serine peptidase [Ilumatobacteraceae bacterium]
MEGVAPLPLDLVLSGRELTEPRLAPGGDRVAFVQRWRGRASISTVDIDGGAEQLVTFGPDPAPGRGFGGGCFDWLPDGSGVVYAAVDGELWRMAGTNLERITSHERNCRGVAAGLVGTRPVVAYVIDEAEIWLQPLDSGPGRRVDDGRHEFCFDPVVSPDGSTVSWQAWSPPAMAWDTAERVDCRIDTTTLAPVSIDSWRPVGGAVQQPRFAPDGTPTCVHDGSGWLTVAVGDASVGGAGEVGAVRGEHAGPTWGMGQRSYAVGRDGSVIVAVNTSGVGALRLHDPVAGARPVGQAFVGTTGQLSLVNGRLAALRSGPTTPPEIVVWRDVGGSDPVERVVARGGVVGWSDIEMPPPVEVATDGDTPLFARRYPAGAGRLLCWVHGGPTDQWPADFRPRIAYWWSRGWDVLVVDPRGTTGHGRAYQQSLNGAWGRLDVDDTAALIRHAHDAGWATPSRTVVIGGSSGGLTVLGVLADHPEVAAGGIASYPVSDLEALASATHRFEAHYTDTLVGPSDDPATAELLRTLSPITRAERITGRLLVFHGTDDPVVPIAQSESLVARIRSGGGTVDFVVYDGEGHGFRDPEHQRDEYERVERFLAEF